MCMKNRLQLFRNIALLFIIILITNSADAQEYMAQFKQMLAAQDTTAQLKLLQQWELKNSKDPDLYVAYFNYYVNRARKEMIQLGVKPKGEALALYDSTGTEPAGYISGTVHYNEGYANKAKEYIDRGIAVAPDRMDIRFGKVFMLGELEEYDAFTNEIVKAIDYGASINYKWKWIDNKLLDDGRACMLDAIQNYFTQLYDTEDDTQMNNMKRIAETVLKHLPKNVPNLSNLAIVYILTDENDKALEVLLRAEKVNPKDAIVLNNIATTYRNMGNKEKAIKYYQLTIQYGNRDEVEFAEEQIALLKGK